MSKILQGSYSGIYSFDYVLNEPPDYPLAVYTSKEDEGFGTYELTKDAYIALGKPNKIKVTDIVEVIE